MRVEAFADAFEAASRAAFRCRLAVGRREILRMEPLPERRLRRVLETVIQCGKVARAGVPGAGASRASG